MSERAKLQIYRALAPSRSYMHLVSFDAGRRDYWQPFKRQLQFLEKSEM